MKWVLIVFLSFQSFLISAQNTIKVNSKSDPSGLDTSVITGKFKKNICIIQGLIKQGEGNCVKEVFLNGALLPCDLSSTCITFDLKANGVRKGQQYELMLIYSDKGSWQFFDCKHFK